MSHAFRGLPDSMATNYESLMVVSWTDLYKHLCSLGDYTIDIYQVGGTIDRLSPAKAPSLNANSLPADCSLE
jgi:hypothetical protein